MSAGLQILFTQAIIFAKFKVNDLCLVEPFKIYLIEFEVEIAYTLPIPGALS